MRERGGKGWGEEIEKSGKGDSAGKGKCGRGGEEVAECGEERAVECTGFCELNCDTTILSTAREVPMHSKASIPSIILQLGFREQDRALSCVKREWEKT